MVQDKWRKLREVALERLRYIPSQGLLVWKGLEQVAGYYDPEGYVQVRLQGKLFQAHQIIWLMVHGEMVDLIDHRDGDKHNNKLNNLREATKQINAINSGLPSNNSSGVKGVSWHKAGRKWTAQIKHNQKKIHLGSYDTLLDAVGARLRAEEELWDDLR